MNNYVNFRGEEVWLSLTFISRQKLDQATVDKLLETHKVRIFIFQKARLAAERKDYKALRHYAKAFELLEYKQQELWGFGRDKNYHHWFELPGCTCPKLDNYDRLGTPYAITNLDCPIHGEKYE